MTSMDDERLVPVSPRHSVRLAREGGDAVLLVEDDGCGFDPALADHHAGRGLNNVRARAAELRGRADVGAELGRGTRMRVRFPLEVRCEVR